MKGVLLLVSVVLVVVAMPQAQSVADEIARAVLAAPAAMAEGASVVRFAADGSHTVLRAGSNGLVCYDRSNEPGRSFAVQCTSEEHMARSAQTHRIRMAASSANDVQLALAAAEADGTREAPKYGSVWYSLAGQDEASVVPHQAHITIAVPFATGEALSLPAEGAYTQAGAWVMEAGTSAAHIMVPGR